MSIRTQRQVPPKNAAASATKRNATMAHGTLPWVLDAPAAFHRADHAGLSVIQIRRVWRSYRNWLSLLPRRL